jgi:hypothetical protein
VRRYEADIDYTTQAMHVRLNGERVGDDGPDVWTTPQGFLRAATSHVTSTRATPLGLEVSFAVEGRRYVGVIDEHDMVDRVETMDATGRAIETLYRDYERRGAVMFPRHVTQYIDGAIALDVWTASVDAERLPMRQALRIAWGPVTRTDRVTPN